MYKISQTLSAVLTSFVRDLGSVTLGTDLARSNCLTMYSATYSPLALIGELLDHIMLVGGSNRSNLIDEFSEILKTAEQQPRCIVFVGYTLH